MVKMVKVVYVEWYDEKGEIAWQAGFLEPKDFMHFCNDVFRSEKELKTMYIKIEILESR